MTIGVCKASITYVNLMMKKIFLSCLLSCCLALNSLSQSILPTPYQMELGDKTLILKRKEISVFAPDTTVFYLNMFKEDVLDGIPVRWKKSSSKAVVRWIEDKSLPLEGYRIKIDKKHITVTAAGKEGFLYAVQTLRQWRNVTGCGIEFTQGMVYDYPRVGWRSFMLDSGRQYQKVATIKKYIEMASLLKMNRFHWHLTEGLGWRIEIKKYPELARKGGAVAKGKEQQGYYTQEEIREIVHYAEERNVTIVPEIDMPGHAEAALSVFPDLGCTGLPVEIPETGFTQHIFCAGKARVRHFLKDVLDEVCTLFPSAYIHLGGDEAPKGNWDACPDCRHLKDSLGLKDSHALQLWFSAEMADYLKEKGRKAVFWEDVIHRDGYPLPDNIVIQWWNYRGHKDLALRKALENGYPIVCNTNYYTYLNFPLTPWRGYEKARTFDIRDIYQANPSEMAMQLGSPLVLGMNCALWTDYVVTEDLIDRRLFPRILALSEQMWHSGERLDFDSFYRLVLQKKPWFESLGFEFGPGLKEEVGQDYKWE